MTRLRSNMILYRRRYTAGNQTRPRVLIICGQYQRTRRGHRFGTAGTGQARAQQQTQQSIVHEREHAGETCIVCRSWLTRSINYARQMRRRPGDAGEKGAEGREWRFIRSIDAGRGSNGRPPLPSSARSRLPHHAVHSLSTCGVLDSTCCASFFSFPLFYLLHHFLPSSLRCPFSVFHARSFRCSIVCDL